MAVIYPGRCRRPRSATPGCSWDRARSWPWAEPAARASPPCSRSCSGSSPPPRAGCWSAAYPSTELDHGDLAVGAGLGAAAAGAAGRHDRRQRTAGGARRAAGPGPVGAVSRAGAARPGPRRGCSPPAARACRRARSAGSRWPGPCCGSTAAAGSCWCWTSRPPGWTPTPSWRCWTSSVGLGVGALVVSHRPAVLAAAEPGGRAATGRGRDRREHHPMTELATRSAATEGTTEPLRLLTSRPRQLVRAVLLGALASGAGVALIGTAAWLLSRAAEQPPVMYLMVAIVGVRAFGIGKGVLRYAERLDSHDLALRLQAGLAAGHLARADPVDLGGTAQRRSALAGGQRRGGHPGPGGPGGRAVRLGRSGRAWRPPR